MSQTRLGAPSSKLRGYGLDAETIRRSLLAAGPDGSKQAPLLKRLQFVARDRRAGAYARLVDRALPLISRLAPTRVVCPICGWAGIEFRTVRGVGWMQRNAICPGCQSLQRQRLMALAYSEIGAGGRNILWVAPEPCLRTIVEAGDPQILTMDLNMDGVDLRADIEALPLEDNRFDRVLCSDVLEHLLDDVQALREIRRVLVPGGLALVHVPILSTSTVEYGFAAPREHDHRRSYGPDIVKRFEAAGLTVEPFLASRFPLAERRRMGLLDWDAVLVGRPSAP